MIDMVEDLPAISRITSTGTSTLTAPSCATLLEVIFIALPAGVAMFSTLARWPAETPELPRSALKTSTQSSENPRPAERLGAGSVPLKSSACTCAGGLGTLVSRCSGESRRPEE
ncbi:hypothetical protein D3C78_1319820 [compost metagenome]